MRTITLRAVINKGEEEARRSRCKKKGEGVPLPSDVISKGTGERGAFAGSADAFFARKKKGGGEKPVLTHKDEKKLLPEEKGRKADPLEVRAVKGEEKEHPIIVLIRGTLSGRARGHHLLGKKRGKTGVRAKGADSFFVEPGG